jgi:hypothetical protein
MNIQTFVFLFRDSEPPRRVPTPLWRDVMAGTLALPGVEGRSVCVVEIDIVEHDGHPVTVRRVDGWQLQFDEYALLDRSQWQEKAADTIQPFLNEVFGHDWVHDEAWLSDSLSRLYQRTPSDTQHWQPSEDQMTQLISQIWR